MNNGGSSNNSLSVPTALQVQVIKIPRTNIFINMSATLHYRLNAAVFMITVNND